jgi:putative transposase
MQRLNTAYSMYFRHKKRRPGHCFQGRYGAKLVEGAEYLVRLTRYVHLNPVKTRRCSRATRTEKQAALEGWLWSSYRGYAGIGSMEKRVDYRWLPLMGCLSMRENQVAYRTYVEGMLEETD